MRLSALTVFVVVGLFAVVLGGAGFVLVTMVEEVVTVAVERVGADATGRRVRLAEPQIHIAPGDTTDLALRLVPGDGFDPEAAFKFDEVSFKLDLAAALANPVVIHEMTVWSPHVTYRLDEGTGTQGPGVDTIVAVGATREFLIETLHFRDGVLLVSAPDLLDRDLRVALPDLELHGVGHDAAQATPGELMRQTVDRILEGAADSDEEADEEDLTARITRSLEELGAALEAQAKAWGKKLGEAADEAGAAINDFLNGKD